jgi:hypothetical protein
LQPRSLASERAIVAAGKNERQYPGPLMAIDEDDEFS